MLDRESILRRGGELELECPDLGSDLMGNNGESKLSYYKHGSVGDESARTLGHMLQHDTLHFTAKQQNLHYQGWFASSRLQSSRPAASAQIPCCMQRISRPSRLSVPKNK